MKENINKIFNKYRHDIDKIINEIQSNSSIFYYCITAILVFGLLFFISSKSIFDKSGEDIRSTNLNEFQTNNTLKAKLISRQYNPISKMAEFIIYAEDTQNFDSKELVFELREQQSPNLRIENRYQKIDDNYYVVLAKVPKKWKVLSLSIGYKSSLDNTGLDSINLDNIDDIDNPNNNNQSSNIPLKSVVRIYSDTNDITHNSFLKEKKSINYFSEIMDLEIEFVKKEIEKLNSNIELDNSKIKDAEDKIIDLKNQKKYQTESEQNTTDTNITKLKSMIATSKSTVGKKVDTVVELQEKISKLKQKRNDFGA